MPKGTNPENDQIKSLMGDPSDKKKLTGKTNFTRNDE
jgi:hypothetical protein